MSHATLAALALFGLALGLAGGATLSYSLALRRNCTRLLDSVERVHARTRQQQDDLFRIIDFLVERADPETQRLVVLKMRRLIAEEDARQQAEQEECRGSACT
jgi:hypothetical protein